MKDLLLGWYLVRWVCCCLCWGQWYRMLCFRSGIVARGRLVGSVSCVSCTILVLGVREGFCGVLTFGFGWGCVFLFCFCFWVFWFSVSVLVFHPCPRSVRTICTASMAIRARRRVILSNLSTCSSVYHALSIWSIILKKENPRPNSILLAQLFSHIGVPFFHIV